MLLKEKRNIYTGGLILITLGVLILLNNLGEYGFNKSWPILLLVVSAAMLFQSPRDKGGWFIGLVGLMFLVKENWYSQLKEVTDYIVPLILIVIGVFVFLRGKKR